MSALDFACPRCDRPAGLACDYGAGARGRGTHVARIVLARKEEDGPIPYDVIYRDGLKYRVLAVYGDEVQLRRGTSHTIHKIARAEISYDAVAGMWREKAAAS